MTGVQTCALPIYADAWVQIQRENWAEAGRQFDEVERQHPYSIWARRAILMSAFCMYQGNRYAEAIDAADRFIQLHPGNKDVPYAYYLKAISLYEQVGDVDRDQQKTEDARIKAQLQQELGAIQQDAGVSPLHPVARTRDGVRAPIKADEHERLLRRRVCRGLR